MLKSHLIDLKTQGSNSGPPGIKQVVYFLLDADFLPGDINLLKLMSFMTETKNSQNYGSLMQKKLISYIVKSFWRSM